MFEEQLRLKTFKEIVRVFLNLLHMSKLKSYLTICINLCVILSTRRIFYCELKLKVVEVYTKTNGWSIPTNDAIGNISINKGVPAIIQSNFPSVAASKNPSNRL